MIDKQIIIDVTQCPYYREGKFCVYLSYKTKCEGDCNWTSYKEMEEQLQAKEQECEELTSKCSQLEEEIKDWQKEVERIQFIGSYGILDEVKKNNELEEQFDQLKSENKHLNDLLNQALKDCEKARETLTEIKELIQSDYCTEIGSCEFCAEIGNCLNRKILQKISEVEE